MTATTPPVRALPTTSTHLPARGVVDHTQVDLQRIAQHMYALMVRNVSSDGFPFVDSSHTLVSLPGCVIAAPSYPANAPGISQDYVFHWVRDAAITALEIVAASDAEPGRPDSQLVDYVRFADVCQRNATPTKGHACFTVTGEPRPWSEQNDGPALQTVAILAAWDRLDAGTQALAADLVARNLDFLLGCYTEQTTNLWEEHVGFSFFARSAQLRCFREVAANQVGLPVPDGVAAAITWLEDALARHWDGTSYRTMLGGESPGSTGVLAVPSGYDPNIDIVQACVYGAVPCTDTRLLATAGQLVAQWADASAPTVYPVNLADAEQGLGPMLGRYPGDVYDGGADSLGDHPWALCTANLAELCYRVAAEVVATGTVPVDALSAPLFDRMGVTATTTPEDAAAALRAAADAMLRAVVYHSDNLELSEQFDGCTGYERSVRDLTWSYAAFLSAVRARDGVAVAG